ncbi:hypothetical protein [Pontibacillus marinus]|uniref:SbsA Ig-like domain-containing protein n=1 Tax=Pontibacillus marinus BH030004 = DSM 16465 TaxID=1385511 RepID=A0A0A5G663_9BACI|nr:hypothetical protein [Pontibacillus marinus]KGX86668.1 hypothetical protein N783_11775 [Pontibacillus marinus BH030004 = DSM 16465]
MRKNLIRTCFIFAILVITVSLIPEVEVMANVKDIDPEALCGENECELYAQYEGNVPDYNHTIQIYSYSENWDDKDKLKGIFQELLQNSYSEEIKFLDFIVLNDRVDTLDGYYHPVYKDRKLTNGNWIELLNMRRFDSDDIAQADKYLAGLIAHEYGHHVTYYYLDKKNDEYLTDNLRNLSYAKYRSHKNVTTNTKVDHMWRLNEIAAEDYVQLYGSEKALINKEYQENTFIPYPQHVPGLVKYFEDLTGMKAKHPTLEGKSEPINLEFIGGDPEKNEIYFKANRPINDSEHVYGQSINLSETHSSIKNVFQLFGSIDDITLSYDMDRNPIYQDTVYKFSYIVKDEKNRPTVFWENINMGELIQSFDSEEIIKKPEIDNIRIMRNISGTTLDIPLKHLDIKDELKYYFMVEYESGKTEKVFNLPIGIKNKHLDATRNTLKVLDSGEGKFNVTYKGFSKTFPYKVHSKAKELDTKYNIPVDKEWNVTFSQDIDFSTVNTNNVYVKDYEGSFIDLNTEVQNKRTLLIRPNSKYESKPHFLYIRNIKSTSGKTITPIVMRFNVVDGYHPNAKSVKDLSFLTEFNKDYTKQSVTDLLKVKPKRINHQGDGDYQITYNLDQLFGYSGKYGLGLSNFYHGDNLYSYTVSGFHEGTVNDIKKNYINHINEEFNTDNPKETDRYMTWDLEDRTLQLLVKRHSAQLVLAELNIELK